MLPALIRCDSREVLLDDSIRLAARLAAATDALRSIGRFLRERLGRPN